MFYLGAHQPRWLAALDVPLMVSRRTLARYKTLPQARRPWFHDSGGFSELALFGGWQTDAETFIAQTRRHTGCGKMAYCAPRDWMCEEAILAKTKKTIAQHQRLTVDDYLDLVQRAPELPWVPVLQGWALDDYLRCLEMYDRAGVDLFGPLSSEDGIDHRPLVGVGTICRRQGTKDAAHILKVLASFGLRLHAFGLKGTGIPNVAPFLASSDSLAWSYAARRSPPLPGCTTHKNCANCPIYALRWLANIEALIGAHQDSEYQLAMAI